MGWERWGGVRQFGEETGDSLKATLTCSPGLTARRFCCLLLLDDKGKKEGMKRCVIVTSAVNKKSPVPFQAVNQSSARALVRALIRGGGGCVWRGALCLKGGSSRVFFLSLPLAAVGGETDREET